MLAGPGSMSLLIALYQDYEAVNQELTFKDGETAKTVLVKIKANADINGTSEYVNATITDATSLTSGVTIVAPSANAYIYNNELVKKHNIKTTQSICQILNWVTWSNCCCS